MPRPSLDLFPEPDALSQSPTWDDIVRLAFHYPSAQNVVVLVERGDMTREQGLIALVHWFATAFSRQFKRETDARAREMPEYLLSKDCGCMTTTYIRKRTVDFPCESHRG